MTTGGNLLDNHIQILDNLRPDQNVSCAEKTEERGGVGTAVTVLSFDRKDGMEMMSFCQIHMLN